jgi:ATP-dependent Clp protease ATP-binding subunit ClpA
VVLLDEIEKAHPDLYNILLQVMDHATLTDNNGRKSDFRNVILIMSSNAGSREMATGKIGFGDSIADGKDGKKALERVFTPEFRNRLDATVMFGALPPEIIRKVARKFLDELDAQLAEKKVELEVSDAAIDWFVEHGYDKAMGARPMGRLVQTTLKAPLANEILFGKLAAGGTAHVDAKHGEITIACVEAERPAN